MADLSRAAQILHDSNQLGQTIDTLEPDCRPANPEQGYAVQSLLAELQNEPVVGWKIAATAQAGRDHINVDRPLAGRLFESMVCQPGAAISLEANRMAVAEAEIVVTLGSDLTPQDTDYTEEQVAKAIVDIRPGLEIPNSRFANFTQVGAACLIADNACANRFVLGPPAETGFSATALADLPTALWINNALATSGQGRDALGGPLAALTWLANTLSKLGTPLLAGQFVTTGVTGSPSTVKAGDEIRVDLGEFGSVSASLT